MPKNNKTIFQRLSDIVIGTGNISPSVKNNNYVITPQGNDVLYRFDNKEDRDKKLMQLKQQKLLSYQWAKINKDVSTLESVGSNQVMMMYRDADIMDTWPEIGSALDTYAEESATISGKDGKVLNIRSSSKRVVSVLEDLFVNRLDIHITLEMIARGLCKYGNEYMFLNINEEQGVLGWRELPVHEMRRLEAGMNGMYGFGDVSYNVDNMKPNDVKFIWDGHNNNVPYENWQVAHFRLIKNSLFLPYGISILHKARRHWRMLSMMEDAMLLYRLERSIERRIFKVNVGLIDDEDVPAFLQEFLNNVKRAPVIDPLTGQLDLRKNFLDVSADYVIPVRNGQDPTSIDTLQSAQNQTSMDDIEYIENKILAALRVPKAYLNYQDAQNKSQNLSIMDIRFNRAVNSVQKALILELTKIAIIHLYLLGFKDDLGNFSLSLNNPSNQIELMELDNQGKRLQNATAALSEQGGGIPLMSWHQVQKEIMGKTDSEISDILNEIRLERAIATELQLTNQIIKKTNVFKKVDNLYGEPGAKYDFSQMEGGPDGGMGGGGSMGGPAIGGFGDDLGGLGEPGMDDMGSIGGDEGEVGLEDSDGGEALMESTNLEKLFSEYEEKILGKKINKDKSDLIENVFSLNDTMSKLIENIDEQKTEKLLD